MCKSTTELSNKIQMFALTIKGACSSKSFQARSGFVLLHDVPLQHGLLRQDASEVESAQVQRLEASIQDELCHGAAHGGGVLQAVPAEARGKVHVVDQRVHADDAVLVEGVVVVVSGPRTRHLR